MKLGLLSGMSHWENGNRKNKIRLSIRLTDFPPFPWYGELIVVSQSLPHIRVLLLRPDGFRETKDITYKVLREWNTFAGTYVEYIIRRRLSRHYMHKKRYCTFKRKLVEILYMSI
jgi:hypothetical protein